MASYRNPTCRFVREVMRVLENPEGAQEPAHLATKTKTMRVPSAHRFRSVTFYHEALAIARHHDLRPLIEDTFQCQLRGGTIVSTIDLLALRLDSPYRIEVRI